MLITRLRTSAKNLMELYTIEIPTVLSGKLIPLPFKKLRKHSRN